VDWSLDFLYMGYFSMHKVFGRTFRAGGGGRQDREGGRISRGGGGGQRKGQSLMTHTSFLSCVQQPITNEL
jgi:hypothetical protein